jgi:hypothetical protein
MIPVDNNTKKSRGFVTLSKKIFFESLFFKIVDNNCWSINLSKINDIFKEIEE